MSDPYNQYGQYSAPPPGSQGYQQPHTGGQYQDPNAYQQQPYGQQYGAYPPQQAPGYDYSQQSGYPQAGAPEGFGPPKRQDSFGPPTAGGFQHGQQGAQFGMYDASNPQGHMGYYGAPPPGQDTRGYDSSQVAPYQQQSYDPNNPNQQGQYGAPHDPNAPYDPNADPNAPEGERGLGSSLVGGAAGYYLGRKKNHGFLGAVGGAVLGNFLGDKVKDKKHSGSSWGGKW